MFSLDDFELLVFLVYLLDLFPDVIVFKINSTNSFLQFSKLEYNAKNSFY